MKVCIKPYTLKELASLYGVCDKTFSKWLIPFQSKIGDRNGRFYMVNQVKIIFDCLGIPDIVEDSSFINSANL